MRELFCAVALGAMLVGCGGIVVSSGDVPEATLVDAAAVRDAPTQEAAPLAPQFSMECPQHGGPLAFKLPCLLGWNLTGARDDPGTHVLECELLDAPARTVMGLMVPMVKLPALLDHEVRIPFDGLPALPYALSVEGTAVFTEADAQARTFRGRIVHARVVSRNDPKEQDACTIDEQPIWAMPGNFL